MNMSNQFIGGYQQETPFRISNNKSGVLEQILYSIGKNPIVQRRVKNQNRITIEGAFISRNTYQ